MEEDVTKTVIKALKTYLHEELPLDKDLFNKLDSRRLLASNTARELSQLADQGKQDCVWKLVTYMEQFYTEEMLLRLCVFLKEYAQQARPKLATIASRIIQEILQLKPQVPLPIPEDTLHRSAGVHDVPVPGTSVLATFPLGASSPETTAPYTSGNVTSSDDRSQPVYLPVIDKLKASFCNLVANVFSAIYCLKDLTLFRTFLSHFLKPSFPPGALPPAVPKTVEELDPFLADRWNSVNIHLLKAVVLHLAARKNESTVFCETIQQVQSELKTYEDLLKVNLHEFLSNCKSKSVVLKPLPGHSSVTVKIASSPAEVSLALIVELKGFFNSQLGLPDTLFTGFSEGCTVLFFSIPTECVWSIPSCLLPSNLSLLEEWKVLFFSVKGAFTVDVKERRVIDSLDKHSLLSSLSEYKTRNDDLQTRNGDLQTRNDDLQTHNGDLQTRNDDLQTHNGDLQTRNDDLQRKVSYFKAQRKRAFPTDRSTQYSTDSGYGASEPRSQLSSSEPFTGERHGISASSKRHAFPTDRSTQYRTDSGYGASEPRSQLPSLEPFTGERHGISVSSKRHDPVLAVERLYRRWMMQLSISRHPSQRELFLEQIARGREVESISKMQFSTILEPSQSPEAVKLSSTHPYWRQEPDIPQEMSWPTAVCVKDEIFVHEREEYHTHLCVFNVVTRRWAELRYHESRELRNNTLATTNNQVHCLGGHWRKDGKKEEWSKVVFTFDCDRRRRQWSDNTLPPLNIWREGATSTSFEGMIVVAGGIGEDLQRLSSVEVLSSFQQSSTWWKICDLPVTSSSMQCTVSDTDLFVGCGVGTERTVYSCDLSAIKELAMVPGDSTSPKSFWYALPEIPVKWSGLAVVSNCLVTVGGRDDHGVATLSAIHLYNSYNDTWTKVSDLRKSRGSPAVVFCNFENKRNLFVVSGWAAPNSVESCEVL